MKAAKHLRDFVLPRWSFSIAVLLIYAFMFLPILVVILASLNPETYIDLPPTGVSLRWYREALSDEWLPALRLSLSIALVVAVAAATIGGFGAFAIARYRFPGRSALQAFLLSPLVVPVIITGVAVLQFLTLINLQVILGLPALILAHVAVTLPLLKPGIFAGMTFAFVISFNNVPVRDNGRTYRRLYSVSL